MDIFGACLKWLMTLEIVGLVATLLTQLGIPPMFVGIAAIGLVMFVAYTYQNDPYILRRWRRRIGL